MEGSILKIAFLTIALSLAVATGCTSFFKRGPSSAETSKPKHYIMTLHGVRGNEVSYGDFHKIVKAHLEKIDPTYEVIPINMTYSIAQPDFTYPKAAIEINAKLDAFFAKNNLNFAPTDRMSVVAYSMGGPVGMTWYYDTLKDQNPAHQQYALKTEKFISLGGAFWGAEEAAVATNNKAIEYVYDKEIKDIAKISFAELKALSIAGAGQSDLRLKAMTQPTKMKWVNVSTLVQCFETDDGAKKAGCNDFQNKAFGLLNTTGFSNMSFGYKRRETDNAVITPSSISNFLYVAEVDPNYTNGKTTPATAFRYALNPSNHKIYFAETLHATGYFGEDAAARINPILGKLGSSWLRLKDDVVLVHNNCSGFDGKTCDHPVYKYILDELASCSEAGMTCDPVAYKDITGSFLKLAEQEKADQDTLKSELHGFTLELNLRVPQGYNLEAFKDDKSLLKYIKMNFAGSSLNPANPVNRTLANSGNSDYQVQIARVLEPMSIIVKKIHYLGQEQLKINFTGIILPKAGKTFNAAALAEKPVQVNFKVELPGLKSRNVEAVVRPYYSTYVDLMMAK